jgi:hypothetical protein
MTTLGVGQVLMIAGMAHLFVSLMFFVNAHTNDDQMIGASVGTFITAMATLLIGSVIVLIDTLF